MEGNWVHGALHQGLSLFSVWGSSGSDVFAVGFGFETGQTWNTILHYNGSDWSEMPQQRDFPWSMFLPGFTGKD